MLISAGFDAHADDPLADCRVSDAGYAAMASAMRHAAAGVGAPIGVVLEGGYALGALAGGRGDARGRRGTAGAGAGGAHPRAREALGRLAERWNLG